NLNHFIQNCTITGNTGGVSSSGIYSPGAQTANVYLSSSIVAGNLPTDVNGATAFPGADHNLIRHGTGPAFLKGCKSQQVGSSALPLDPQILPLANNGGPTQTHALKPTSPAIDAGANPAALAFDQRGTPFTRQIATSFDIGAYERDTIPPTKVLGSAPNVN